MLEAAEIQTGELKERYPRKILVQLTWYSISPDASLVQKKSPDQTGLKEP
jgi:hypothetical protein